MTDHINDPAQRPVVLSSEQVMAVVRKVTAGDLRKMLTCKRWKDGIDIDEPTFAAERLAEEFIALAAAGQPPAAPVENPECEYCKERHDPRLACPAYLERCMPDHLPGCSSGDFGPCDCGAQPRSSAGNVHGCLLEKLRAVDHGSIEDCFCQSPLFVQAADEIERLRSALQAILKAAEDGDEMSAVSMAEAALEPRK